MARSTRRLFPASEVRAVRAWRGTIGAWVLFGTLAGAGPAEAAPNVAYAAPADCPTVEAFTTEFVRLTQGSPVPAEPLGFDVVVAQEQREYRGTIEVVVPAAGRPPREVRGESCVEVVRALAFIAAVHAYPELALAKGSTSQYPDTEPERSENPPVTPPPAPPPSPKPPVVVVAPPSRPPPASSNNAAAEQSDRFQLGLFASLGFETALEPGVAVSPRLGITMRHSLARDWRIDGALSGTLGQSGTIAGTVGDADLSWTVVRASGCLDFRRFAMIALAPCLFLDLGELRGAGTRIDNEGTGSTIWVAPGVLGRVALEPFRSLSFFVEAGGFVPLNRPTFYFETRDGGTEPVHEVPPFGLTGAIGVAGYFL